MTEQNTLNEVQKFLMDFAIERGLDESNVHEQWDFNYKRDAQNYFDSRIEELTQAVKLSKQAMSEGDLVTVQAGMVRASIATSLLRDFFGDFNADLRRALTDFKMPEIPDPYVIPTRYGYKGKL